MKLFGITIKPGKALVTVAKAALPVVVVAVATKTPLKKAITGAIEDEVQRQLNQRGA